MARTVRLVVVLFCLVVGQAVQAQAGGDHAGKAAALVAKGGAATLWLENSLTRVFPNSPPGVAGLRLRSARNARIAFQVCVRSEGVKPLRVECAVAGADELKPRVRLVGLVPMAHHTPNTPVAELDGLDHVPGLVPDPLYPETGVTLGPRESRSFWITLNVPADAAVGPRDVMVSILFPDQKRAEKLTARLDVAPLVVPERRDFHVIHWWRGEATWDYYKTGMFEDPRWWEITRLQLADMLDHGTDVIYVPIFFDRREQFKRPCQLLVVNEPQPGKYEFDFSRVKQFTDMAKKVGFKRFEWSHLWIYWGVENPIRVYKKQGGEYVMLWPGDISGFSDTYVNFLKQFLPQFHKFLADEGLLETSYFHLSDEPGSGKHVENYRRARKILHELAPWMKVMDALSDIRYGREGLTDMPIPIVSSAKAYVDAGIPHWVYYCCGPTGPWVNRFMDTPLPKIRMAGWLFYRHGAKGFLHWGYNYWHKMETEQIGDPFNDASNGSWPGIPFGDPFEIYPGKDGRPIDSIRWEVFAESLQDYAILEGAGVRPEDPLLAGLKTYADFPKSATWIDQAMKNVLESPAK
jgi:hypothetical protein